MPARIDARPVRVDLLALADSTPAALHSLLEVFSAVGVAWNEITGENTQARRMPARIVARRRMPFASPLGPPIAPQAALRGADDADVVVVTDLSLTADVDPRGRWRDEAAWLRARFAAGATICSVCTGALVLAEAGLLDDVEATTHWSAARLLAEHYPRVRVRAERVLCPGGPEHRVVTSGGPASWEDLALYLIARFAGEAEAVRIAKIFLLGDRSEGQLVLSALGRPRRHADAAVADCQAWLAGHYAAANPVARMMRRSGLAPRTFVRRFKAATGYTPVAYVHALRIEEAKQALERGDDPVETVARDVGYDDPGFFRRLFKRHTGVTPARYRRRFRKLIPLAAPRS